jgi:hypothetical protein
VIHLDLNEQGIMSSAAAGSHHYPAAGFLQHVCCISSQGSKACSTIIPAPLSLQQRLQLQCCLVAQQAIVSHL